MKSYIFDTITACTKSIRDDKLLYAFIFSYAIIAVIIVVLLSEFSLDTLQVYTKVWLVNYGVIYPLIFLSAGLIRIVHRLDNRRALAFRHMFNTKRTGRFLAGTVLFVGILIFTTSFTSIKNTFSVETPFLWDVRFADIDNLLHLGNEPWQLLYTVFQSDLVLKIIEVNYNVIWFILNYTMLYWIAVSTGADAIRTRYMLSVFITWAFLGTAIGPLFLSAGPAFYGAVTGDISRFAEQMTFLATSKGSFSSAADYQSYLWFLYQGKTTSFGSGILAFPSVHVGFVTLNALFVWEYSKKLGIIAFAYVGLILFSSVYLAWHYAIDGYFSIIVTIMLFYIIKALIPPQAPQKQ